MFKGSIVAIVTPMLDGGDIDYQAYSCLLDWHLENKTDGIVVLGTTGESATVTMDERKKLVTTTIDQINGRIPVIVGTGANSTDHAVELTQQAMALGADAALLVTPYYNKPTQEGLYRHYKKVAEAVSLPQILYNVPSRTACDLLPETVIRLASISNIVGVKEATAEIDRVKTIIDSGAEIDLYSGDDRSGLELIKAGGKAIISVAANIVPRAFHDMCATALSGDFVKAEEINQKLMPLYKALMAESNPIPTKWALMAMGMITGGIRLPLTPLDKQYHELLRTAMQQVGI